MPDPYLGTRTLMRALLDATQPDGHWNPAPGKDLDHLMDGLGDDLQTVTDAMALLAAVRDPRTTPYLDELEREYGITPNTQLTNAQRRANLLDAKYRRNRRGTLSDLQDALDRSGLGGTTFKLDRGDCESVAPPAITPDVAVVTLNCSFTRSTAAPHHSGNSHFVFAQAAAGASVVWLHAAQGPGAGMHGYIAGHSYYFRAWILIPSSNPVASARINLYTYVGATGGSIASAYANTSIVNQYQFVSFVVTIPLNTTAVDTRLVVDSGGGLNYNFLIDDIDITDLTAPWGYGLKVFANDPAVDPGPYTQYAFITECNSSLSSTNQCGYNTGGAVLAVCGVSGGMWVVNGDVFTSSPAYLGCGDPRMCCGYFPTVGSPVMAECGIYYTLTYVPITILSPVDSWTWPLCFFIAAGATKDGGGHITALTMASIPSNLRATLIEQIVRVKPMHSWCALMVTFV